MYKIFVVFLLFFSCEEPPKLYPNSIAYEDSIKLNVKDIKNNHGEFIMNDEIVNSKGMTWYTSIRAVDLNNIDSFFKPKPISLWNPKFKGYKANGHFDDSVTIFKYLKPPYTIRKSAFNDTVHFEKNEKLYFLVLDEEYPDFLHTIIY